MRAAEERFAVGQEESGERPAALPADGADGGLIAGVNVGALVAIYLNGDEMLVDDLGDGGIFVTFAIDDVAPVAPDGANVEKDRLIGRLRGTEGLFAPFMPADRLVRGGT